MSVLTETLQDSARAFVDGFNRDILYLSDEKHRVPQTYMGMGQIGCNAKPDILQGMLIQLTYTPKYHTLFCTNLLLCVFVHWNNSIMSESFG